MKPRCFVVIAALLVSGTLTWAPAAHAETSTQGFIATVTTTVDGDIYRLDGWTTTDGQTGYFTSYDGGAPIDPTFNIKSTTGDLSFSDSTFGSFTSTSLTVDYNGANGAIFDFKGLWKPGTLHADPPAGPASLVITISKNNGTFAASGVMAVTSTPEPSSVVLGLASLTIGGLAYGLRRRRAGK